MHEKSGMLPWNFGILNTIDLSFGGAKGNLKYHFAGMAGEMSRKQHRWTALHPLNARNSGKAHHTMHERSGGMSGESGIYSSIVTSHGNA